MRKAATKRGGKIAASNNRSISHSPRAPEISTSRIEFTLGSIRTSNMHTGNFESAALPGNLRQDGVYMTNDRIPYAKKSTLPQRFFSRSSPLFLLLLILPLPLFCSFHRRAFASNTLITRREFACPHHLSLSFSLTLSLSLVRVISHPLRYYERACNGNRRMIHGDVKRDGSRCRLETQSLPIRKQPMPREESGVSSLPLIKILKRQSIKRVDVERSPERRR